MKLLEQFYNERININPLFEIDFKDIPQENKDRMKQSFSFKCYELKHNWNDLKSKINFIAFFTYSFVTVWSLFIIYLVYLGLRTLLKF